jgi:hypothetical protein
MERRSRVFYGIELALLHSQSSWPTCHPIMAPTIILTATSNSLRINPPVIRKLHELVNTLFNAAEVRFVEAPGTVR